MKITQSIDLKKSQGKRCPFYSDRSDCSFLYCSYQYGNGICNSIYRGACIIFTSWSAGKRCLFVFHEADGNGQVSGKGSGDFTDLACGADDLCECFWYGRNYYLQQKEKIYEIIICMKNGFVTFELEVKHRETGG